MEKCESSARTTHTHVCTFLYSSFTRHNVSCPLCSFLNIMVFSETFSFGIHVIFFMLLVCICMVHVRSACPRLVFSEHNCWQLASVVCCYVVLVCVFSYFCTCLSMNFVSDMLLKEGHSFVFKCCVRLDS